MKILNAIIITSDDTVIEMTADELHNFYGNVIMCQEKVLSRLEALSSGGSNQIISSIPPGATTKAKGTIAD